MQTTTHPTDFAAFRRMLSEMTMMELDEMSSLIEIDIVKHVDEYSSRHDIQEWSQKIRLIAEEKKTKSVLKLQFDDAA